MDAHWSTSKVKRIARTAVIIGGGPSLVGYDWHAVQEAQKQGRVYVIAVNDAYRFGFPNLCLFGDAEWWSMPNRGDGWGHSEALEAFANAGNMVLTCAMPSSAQIEAMTACPYMNMIKRGPQSGLSVKPDSLAWGGNTGAAAINLALLMGATAVLLFGYDCKAGKANEPNWHENPLMPVPRDGLYEYFTRGFRAIAEALPTTFPGVPVLNAGPDSDLMCFPKVNKEELARWM